MSLFDSLRDKAAELFSGASEQVGDLASTVPGADAVGEATTAVGDTADQATATATDFATTATGDVTAAATEAAAPYTDAAADVQGSFDQYRP